MSVIETIFSGLVIAFISTLGWLAYKHPHAYSKIYSYLYGFFFITYICVFSYNLGLMKAFGDVISINLSALIFICIFIYLGLLSLLPKLLEKENDKKPE